MASLFGSLSIAMRALLAEQGALGTSADNIANVNTPGFARRRAIFSQEPPVAYGALLFGSGVTVEKVEAIRDRILELRLHQETQQQERLDAFLGSMRQVEALFNEAQGAGLEGVLSKFFDSLQALSVNPTSRPLRQGILAAGQDLAAAFRRAAKNLATLKRNLDQAVARSVGEINRLTVEIAELNRQVSALEGVGREPGVFADRRNLLINQLSVLVDVTVIEAENGSLTLTTANGTALVVGGASVALNTQVDPATGFQHILSQGADITATLTAGKLAALLEVRDAEIPSLLADLDNLAAGLIQTVNTQHRAGFDLAGAPGGDFFAPFVPPVPGSNAGAAASFAMALSDPGAFAASADATPGNNENVMSLAALRNQALAAGQRPTDFYANLTFRIGNKIAVASAQLEAEALVLRQLENQRSAISGVSLDEEATNLIRYQRAFEAAARVVATVDELTEVAINLGRG